MVSPELIDRPRSNLQEALRAQKEEKERQKKLGEICAQMRLDCEALLKRYGITKKNIPFWGIVAATFPISLPTILGFALVEKRGPLEYFYSKLLRVSVNINGEPIIVSFSSQGEPQRSFYINIRIQGIDEWLRLSKNSGFIYRSPKDLPERELTSQEAQSWKELVDFVKTQYPVTSSSTPQP